MAKNIVVIEDRADRLRRIAAVLQHALFQSDDRYFLLGAHKRAAQHHKVLSSEYSEYIACSSLPDVYAAVRSIPQDWILLVDVDLPGVHTGRFDRGAIPECYKALLEESPASVLLMYSGSIWVNKKVEDLISAGVPADRVRACQEQPGKDGNPVRIVMQALNLYYGSPFANVAVRHLLSQLCAEDLSLAEFRLLWERGGLNELFAKGALDWLLSPWVLGSMREMAYD